MAKRVAKASQSQGNRPAKASRRAELVVRSNIRVPEGLAPWERELLLPHVPRLLAAVVGGPAHVETKKREESD